MARADSSARGNLVPLQIRWWVAADLPRILEIERRCYEVPWNEEDFRDCTRGQSRIVKIAEAAEITAGFMIYELNDRQFHVLNLAVDPAFRRLTIGAQLVDTLKAHLVNGGRRSGIRADVRESNLPAQLFFRAAGFRCVQVLRRHYGDEDAYSFLWDKPAAVRRDQS